MRRVRRLAGCRGAVPIEFALGVGVLVLPIAMMVATFPTWAERSTMARVAASEAARAAALATDAGQGEAVGAALAVRIAENHGAGADLVGLSVTVDRDEHGDPHRRGGAHAEVAVRMPLTALPFIGEAGGFTYTARHTEPVHPHRSLP